MIEPAVDVLCGDVREVLRSLPDQSVQCCVTSPPYWGLRDYGVEGQLGLEKTPDEYVAAMVDVFREVRRVLRDDGTLWLNLGDSYAASGVKGSGGIGKGTIAGGKGQATNKGSFYGDAGSLSRNPGDFGLKPKDLVGIPWRVAFALQADGWYLRQDIIWHKPNPMPESVTDRCTKSHEYIFLLSKSARYYFDSNAIAEPALHPLMVRQSTHKTAAQESAYRGNAPTNLGRCGTNGDGTRNRRSVWTITTKPFRGAHFATFPPDLVEPCIVAGAPPECCITCEAPYTRVVEKGEPDTEHMAACGADAQGEYHGTAQKDYAAAGAQDPSAVKARILAGMVKKHTIGWMPSCECWAGSKPSTVLDPFGGSGTTGMVAKQHGRNAVLIELNPDYLPLIMERTA